jgi:hypothetical protein
MTADPARDELRTAWHEASHAVILLRLTGTVPPTISIDPAVCFGSGRRPDFADHDPDAPLCLANPDLRRLVEADIIVRLAGHEAERLALPVTARVQDPPEVVALARAAQPPKVLELLDIIDAEPASSVLDLEAGALDDPRSDDAVALDLALRLAGMRANHYIVWCRVEAAALVGANLDAIRRLAAELLQRRIMGAAAILAILESEEVPDAEPAV